MRGNLDNPPVVVRTSRWKALWGLLGSIFFVGAAIAILRDPAKQSHFWIAYAGAAFFGLGIPIFIALLLRPHTLEIGPSGLVWRNLFRTESFRWRDVRDFRPYRPSAKVITPAIGFDFADDYKPQQRRFRWVVRQCTGVAGSLGSGWELNAAELANLLNAARARWATDH
jgi:hypothetical protein